MRRIVHRSPRHAVAWAIATVVSLAACAGSTPAPAVPGPVSVTIPPDSTVLATVPGFIQVIPRAADARVDILVGGQPFTTYVYPDDRRQATLTPIRAASGAVIAGGTWTGSAAEPQGFWLGHGAVNGLDFWSVGATSPRGSHVVQRAVSRAVSGPGEGTLQVTHDWVDGNDRLVVQENVTFIFRARGDARSIDRITTFVTGGAPVTFDNGRTGLVALRVAPSLAMSAGAGPDNTAMSPGAGGAPAAMPKPPMYRTSAGTTGGAIDGSHARWLSLAGVADGSPVTVILLDHPKNPGFPTAWTVRPDGFVAANPFSGRSTDNTASPSLRLGPNERVVFRHQLMILPGSQTPEQVERVYEGFAR